MSASVCNNFGVFSPLMVDEEISMATGIVTILGSDAERSKTTTSFRRTLSADMSSKKWLSQNGFSPIKRNASSQQFPVLVEDHRSSSSEEEEDCPGQDDVWRSIQAKKEKSGEFQVWSSILCQKSDDHSAKNLPAYVHPLVKSSARSMSEKSLRICTESLGSETGSDVFSSYSPSENGDAQEEKEEGDNNTSVLPSKWGPLQGPDKEEEILVARKSSPRSFPPSLPSLSHRHIQSHREGGRLVLEAVTVQSKNYFQADRHNGRLLLTFVNNSESDHEEEIQNKDKIMGVRENWEHDMRIVMDQSPRMPSGVINVHRSAFVMKNFMGIHNMNPIWTPNKFNKGFNLMEMEKEMEEEMEMAAPLAQSLPMVARLIPKPPPTSSAAVGAAATSFNAYEYFWKTKPNMPFMIKPIAKNTNPKAYEKQDLVILRRNCKEGRRSLLFWEPYCIATS